MTNPEPVFNLEDFLDHVDDLHTPQGSGDREHFRITDDNAAAWAMRKLRRLRRQQQTNDDLATLEIERIAEWRDKVNKPLVESAHYFEAILSHYAEQVRHDPDDGRKTINLPGGKVATRFPSPKWEIDSEIFLAWARDNAPEFVRVKEDPNLSAMKIAATTAGNLSADPDTGIVHTTDGEILPGVTITDASLSVSISIDLDN